MSTASAKARLAAATPGPWEPGVTYNYARNADFIAHARTDLELAVEFVEATLQLLSDESLFGIRVLSLARPDAVRRYVAAKQAWEAAP